MITHFKQFCHLLHIQTSICVLREFQLGQIMISISIFVDQLNEEIIYCIDTMTQQKKIIPEMCSGQVCFIPRATFYAYGAVSSRVYYSTGRGGGTCIMHATGGGCGRRSSSCKVHSDSPVGSSASTACICNKGYSGANGGICTACEPGKYKDVTGSAPCISATSTHDALMCPPICPNNYTKQNAFSLPLSARWTRSKAHMCAPTKT